MCVQLLRELAASEIAADAAGTWALIGLSRASVGEALSLKFLFKFLLCDIVQTRLGLTRPCKGKDRGDPQLADSLFAL